MSQRKDRYYQADAKVGIKDAFAAGHIGVLIVLPTGTGKTVIFTGFAADEYRDHKKVTLVLVNRAELLDQAAAKMRESGLFPSVINPKHKAMPGAACYVASIETLNRRDLPSVDYIVCDEMHIEQHDKILDKYREAHPTVKIIGFTATPERAKGTKRPLHKFFSKMIEPIDTPTAISEGFLVRAVTYGAMMDLSGVDKTKNGDFNEASLYAAFNKSKLYDGVVRNYQKFAAGKRAICFSVNVAHSLEMCRRFNQAGIKAVHVDGTTPEAQRIMAKQQFAAGLIQVLCNCGVFTTGFDDPGIEAVILNRATTSLPLFLQMCLDLDTEVLTADGWKRHDQISDGESVASFNQETGAIRFAPHLGKTFRPVHEGEWFCRAKGTMSDFRVTNQHDMLFRSRRSTTGSWIKTTAENLKYRKSEYQLPVSGHFKTEGIGLSEAELTFIGWVLSDGTVNKNTGSICISQSVAQPESHHESIRAAIEGCGFKYGTFTAKRDHGPDLIQYSVSKGIPRGRDKHLSGWERLAPFLDKEISQELYNCTPGELSVLLAAINLGDGAKHRNQNWNQQSYHISTGNQRYADRLQALCVLKGFRCNVTTHFYNKSPLYVLHIKRQETIYMRGENQKDGTKISRSLAKSNEQVWCLTTVDGTLITRRNGKVLIMGNCGRGSRPVCNVNFDTVPERLAAIEQSPKDKFVIIDHGSNWTRFGYWSDPREWDINPEKRKKTPGVAPTRFCPGCEAIIRQQVKTCEWCGIEIPYEQRTKELLQSEFVKLGEGDIPDEIKSKKWGDMSIPELEIYRKWKDYHVKWVVQQLRLQAKKLSKEREAAGNGYTQPSAIFTELVKLYADLKGYKSSWAYMQNFGAPDEPEHRERTTEPEVTLDMFTI